MKLDLPSLRNEIASPGRTLAFCDETDLTIEPTSTTVGNIHLYGGVVMSSEEYGHMAAELAAYLDKIGQNEFHGTEIINPKPKSSWKALDCELRAKILDDVFTIIAESNLTFVHVRIPKEQFLEKLKEAGIETSVKHKSAVKDVFLKSLGIYLQDKLPAVLVIDRDRNTPGPSIEKFGGGDKLLAGGAISVHSHELIGLQIADLLAYAIGRFMRRRDTIAPNLPVFTALTENSDPNGLYDNLEIDDPFDKVITTFVSELGGRLFDLLKYVAAKAREVPHKV